MCASMGECCVHVDPYVKIQLVARAAAVRVVAARAAVVRRRRRQRRHRWRRWRGQWWGG